MSDSYHDQTSQGRLLAVGDIHGCLSQLQELLQKVNPQPEDQVVFLGDYIDRGPDSAGVVDYLLRFQQRFPFTVFLLGNHEQMLLDFLEGEDPTAFLLNGGAKTLASYQASGRWPMPEDHLEFFLNLAFHHETDQFIFVHAGLRPEIPFADQLGHDLIWIRHDFVNTDYSWGKTIVYGHTPLDKPFFSSDRIGLDTGCVYGRQLTCCDVLSREIWQV